MAGSDVTEPFLGTREERERERGIRGIENKKIIGLETSETGYTTYGTKRGAS